MPASAACDATAPANDATMTCAAGVETDPIVAPNSSNVTVDFLAGATLQTPTSPAISLGGGAQVNLGSGTITDIDPASIPSVIGDVIAGDYSGIVDRQDFVDLFAGIAATGPVIVPPGAATIELGVPSDVAAREAALEDITGVVTVQKAKMNDQAMNAITQYITSSYDPNFGLPTGGPILEAPGTNQIVISGGTIVAGGAAAIRAADGSATRVLVTGGGAIASLAENAPAISMGEDSALHVVLGELQSTTPSGGTIFTAADGAAGIDAGRDASALAVYLLGDSHITTTGDNAAAIIGPGSSSVMAFEARGGLSTDGRPMIATFGDNSGGVFMHGTESSTATLHIRDLYETAFGPGMQTSGDNSTLFDIDLGEGSSISFIASSSNLGTFGDGSGVIRLLEADNSDVLTFLNNVALTSAGHDSTLFESATGFSSVSSLVAIGFDLDAVGNGSGGIIQRVVNGGGNSADTSFLGNGTIDTQGDDASAFLLEQGGVSSVRTVVVDASDFSTLGEDSHGFYVGGLGDGSALEVTMSDVTITTVGNGSRGLFVGDLGDGSASTTSLLDLDVTTVGHDATAAYVGGATHSGSVSSVDIARSSFGTEGDRSAGLVVPGLIGVGGDGVFVVSMSDVAASTLGDDSAGIRVGDPDVDLGGPANIFDSSRSHTFIDLDIETAGDRSIGLAVYGFGDGSINSDISTVLQNSSVRTKGNDSTGVLLDVFGDGPSNVVNVVVVVDTVIDTMGDRAAGLVIGDELSAHAGAVDSNVEVSAANLQITTLGDDASGLIVAPGADGTTGFSATTLSGITIATEGDRSHGIVLGKGQDVLLTDISITTSGTDAFGLWAQSDLSTDELDVTVATTGDGATGMLFEQIGDATTQLHTGFRANVTTAGDDAAGLVFGELGPGSALDRDASFIAFDQRAMIATVGDRAAGVVFGGAASGSGDVFIGMAGHHYDVTTSGDDSAGVIFNVLNDMTTQEAVFVDMNFNVDTVGDRSAGVIFGATQTETPANATITAFQAADVSVDIRTTGDDATGFFFGPGALPSGDYTVAAVAIGGTVVTSGDNSPGIVFTEGLSKAELDQTVKITLTNLYGDVTTSGDNSHGIILGDGLGIRRLDMDFHSSLDIGDGLAATTSGANSHALVISENTALTMDTDLVTLEPDPDPDPQVDEPSVGPIASNGLMVIGTIDSFDAFAATGTNSRAVMNHGTIYGTFTVSDDVVGNLGNNGLIESALGAGGVAVQFTGTTNDIFELQTEGVVIGSVEAGAGTDTFILGGTGAQSFDQTLIGTQYYSFELFQKTGSSTWTLADYSAAPIWEVREGELIVHNEFIDPIAMGFTVHGGATLTLANTEPAATDTGADNRFEIQPGAIVNGNVFAGLGTDTFVLGGPGTGSFDVALIGTQYNGFEQFEKTGSSTWELTGSSALLTTPFLVREGTLNYNAEFENLTLTIEPGARAGGTGTVGELVIETGGIVAPGNSIGTLTVVGNADFASGSIYEVEIRSGGNVPGVDNDLIVAGTATIAEGAIFRITPENGTDTGTGYTPDTIYTIIETIDLDPTTLTVAGTGPIIAEDFAFLDFAGSFDGKNYYLTSSAVAASFCLPGASFNQCQSGEAVRDLGPGHVAFDEVVGMSEANANAAFNALSGEIHASGQHVIDQTFALFSGALKRNGGTAGSGGGTAAPLGYGAGRVVAIEAGTDPLAATHPDQYWLMPLGGRGTVEADGNAAELEWAAGGLAGGYETAIATARGAAFAGVAFGYATSHGAVPARQSSLDVDGLYAGIYGGFSDGPWSVMGAMSVAASHIATERSISFGDIDETASASYSSQAVRLTGEAAYGFELDGRTTLAPLFTLDAGWSGHGGFTETGAGALNLTGDAESWARFDAGIGVAISHTALTELGEVTLDGRLIWEHAFADVVPSQQLAFADAPTGFEVRGPDTSRDRLRLGLGASLKATDDISIRAGYSGVFSGGQHSHAVQLGFNVRF